MPQIRNPHETSDPKQQQKNPYFIDFADSGVKAQWAYTSCV